MDECSYGHKSSTHRFSRLFKLISGSLPKANHPADTRCAACLTWMQAQGKGNPFFTTSTAITNTEKLLLPHQYLEATVQPKKKNTYLTTPGLASPYFPSLFPSHPSLHIRTCFQVPEESTKAHWLPSIQGILQSMENPPSPSGVRRGNDRQDETRGWNCHSPECTKKPCSFFPLFGV